MKLFIHFFKLNDYIKTKTSGKGLRKVTGKFALFYLGYNLERAKYILGFQKIMEQA